MKMMAELPTSRQMNYLNPQKNFNSLLQMDKRGF